VAYINGIAIPQYCFDPIGSSVGLFGKNNYSDVEQIRQMINDLYYLLDLPGIGPYGRMVMDTLLSEFIHAIIDFQRRFANIEYPHGLIEPNSKTYQQLFYMITDPGWLDKPKNLSKNVAKNLYYDWNINKNLGDSLISSRVPYQILDREKDKPTVLDFAQLALDVYNDPHDDNLRDTKLNKSWNNNWIKVDTWPRQNDYALRGSYARSLHDKIKFLNSLKSKMNINDQEFQKEYDIELLKREEIKHDYDDKTGLYAAFYVNKITAVGVVALRGTAAPYSLTLGADTNYVFNSPLKQYEEAKEFVNLIKKTAGSPKIYVCGHSLGGILAKMIAPVSGLNTIAFNSPGVKEFLSSHKSYIDIWHKIVLSVTADLALKTMSADIRSTIFDSVERILNKNEGKNIQAHHLPNKLSSGQRVVTYCAKADPIGNLRNDNDFEPYKWLDVLGGEKIPEAHDRLFDVEFMLDSIYRKNEGVILTRYHGMKDMYKAIQNTDLKNDSF
jgi:hypothetical protein